MMNRSSSMLLVLLAAACAPGSGGARPPAPAVPVASADTTPEAVLTLQPYVARLRTVPVAVADSSLPFLFDTGGGITLVTPAVAGALGCEPFGRMVGFRHNGEPVTLTRCPDAALDIGGWSAPPAEPGVWDLMALLPEGLPVLGGLVALNSFDGRAVTLELGDGRLIVESPASLARRMAIGTEVPLRLAHQAAGASLDVFLAIDAEPAPLWFELDSGNTGPVLIAPHAARQLGLQLSPTEATTVELTVPGFGPIAVDVMEKEMIYDGLLNAAFLEELTVTLDLAAGRAWIAP